MNHDLEATLRAALVAVKAVKHDVIGQIAAQFFESPPGTIGETTLETYGHLYECHLKQEFGHLPVTSITPAHITRYRTKRKKERVKHGKEPRPFTSSATRNREVSLLKVIINFGVRNGMAPYNPIAHVEREKEHNVRETVVGEEIIEKLLERAEPWLAAYILVCVDSGLRRQEACHIRWEHIDPVNHLLHVGRTWAKGKKARTTVLTRRTLTALLRLERKGPWVFPSDRYVTKPGPLQANYCLNQFRNLCDVLGIKGPNGNIWLHDLRRSFVTNMRRRGVAETVIMGLSGHASHDVFKRYAIVGNEDITSALKKYEDGGLRERAASAEQKRRRGPHRAGQGSQEELQSTRRKEID